MNHLKLIYLEDCTTKFKEKIFNLKLNPALEGACFAQYAERLHALRHITYMTNLTTINNTYELNGQLIECKTQSGDRVDNYSTIFLN